MREAHIMLVSKDGRMRLAPVSESRISTREHGRDEQRSHHGSNDHHHHRLLL
jgi:hypothetical protein